jgi:predicted transglutaminase-like cysteine proteinase
MATGISTVATLPLQMRSMGAELVAILLALGLGLALAAGSGAHFPAQARSPLLASTVGQVISAPLPMQYFCARHPAECRASRPTQMVLTDRAIRLLQQVNTEINASIRPMRNPPGGWKIYPAAGDCNDYALTKRSALIRLGFPAGALRIAVTRTRLGDAHAILVIKTDIGDLVLDNLSPDVKSLRNSGYTLRMMSGPNPQRWVRI